LIQSNEALQSARLDEVAEFVMGQAPPGADCNMTGQGTVFVKTGEFGALYPEVREWTTRPLKFAKQGDVLICVVGATVGKLNLAIDCAIGRSVAAIRPKQVVDTKYLYYSLVPFTLDLRRQSRGSAQGVIGKAELGSVTVRVPPLAEQSRIVTRVEELMRLCDALETQGQLEAAQHAQLVQSLLGALTASATPDELADNWQRVATHFDLLLDRPEAVDALEQTILQLAVRGLLVSQDPKDEPAGKLLERIQTSRQVKRRIVVPDDDLIDGIEMQLPIGWAWAVVDQLSADAEYAITDGPFGANLKTEHYIASNGYRVVRLQNIGYGEFREEHRAYIDKERFERLQKHQVFSGDLLVAGLVDESIRCCRVPESLGPAIVKADCYRFSVHEAMHAGYVDLYLGSSLAHEFAAVHHHGLTLTRIGLGNFRSIPVPIPPYSEQVRIVARVESLRRHCADLRQRLSARQTTQAHLAEALIDEVA
jgi:type I restriction enzyme S subunit